MSDFPTVSLYSEICAKLKNVTRTQETGKYLLPVLVPGIVLLLLLLLASGWVSIDSMQFIESDASRFVSEQQGTARLIEEVHSEQGNLSNVFYSLATGHDIDRAELLKRLEDLESAIHNTINTGAAASQSQQWEKVRRATARFIEEGRATIRSSRPPSDAFYQHHQALLSAIAELASASFSPNGAVAIERQRLSSRIHYVLILLGIAVVVAVLGAVFTIYFVSRMFFSLRWQAAELAHLSSRTMSDQEEAATRLSREMHDHLGQTLSALEANLVAMLNARAFHSGRLEDCLGLVKDAVGNAREVSQLLRPTILDDFGLNDSLRWLADSFAERTGKTVRYASSFTGRLDSTTETQLFRIAQEALTNVARHAEASEVRIALEEADQVLRLTVIDNGKGMPQQAGRTGIGLIGMRARARVAHGTLVVESPTGAGVRICAEVPLPKPVYAPEDSHTVSR